MLLNKDISTKQKSSMELIWQNQSATSSFSPQTVNLPTGYLAFIIEFKFYRTQSTYPERRNVKLYVPFSTSNRYFIMRDSTDVTDLKRSTGRYITSAIDGSLVFGAAYNPTTSQTIDNNYAIPVAIYGLKFTL